MAGIAELEVGHTKNLGHNIC